MIFVTVGGQLPFDRLIRAVDHWAGKRGRTDIFAQIGDASFEPSHVAWQRFLTPADFQGKLQEAAVVVAHAGMGTILTCLELGKPILIFPRNAALGEQRNDHQLATAKRFRERGDVHVAMEEGELVAILDRVDALKAAARLGPRASEQLLEAIRSFVSEGQLPNRRG